MDTTARPPPVRREAGFQGYIPINCAGFFRDTLHGWQLQVLVVRVFRRETKPYCCLLLSAVAFVAVPHHARFEGKRIVLCRVFRRNFPAVLPTSRPRTRPQHAARKAYCGACRVGFFATARTLQYTPLGFIESSLATGSRTVGGLCYVVCVLCVPAFPEKKVGRNSGRLQGRFRFVWHAVQVKF